MSAETLDLGIMQYAEHNGLVTVDVVKYEEKTFILQKPEWRLNETRKRLLWLQKFCFWLLRKMGCYTSCPVEHTTLMRVNYRPQSILDALITASESAEFGFNRQPSVVLVGRKTYMELLRESGQHTAAMYLEQSRDPAPPYLGRYGWRNRVIGINVYEVPWLDGVVVL